MPSLRYIDTHCHVQFAAYRMDGPQVIRAALAGGTWMVAVGTQSTTSTQAVSTAERYAEGVYATIGLHPGHLFGTMIDKDELHEEMLARPERFDPQLYGPLAQNPKVVAVGEIGMDLYRLPEGVSHADAVKAQEEQFRLQISFADANDLPVVIHCRDAHKEVRTIIGDVIRAGGLRRRGVIHSFSGTWKEAEAYLDLGFRIGFNGIVTFPAKKGQAAAHEALMEAVRKVPSEAFVLETDAPYLSPVPMRGARNRPDHVAFVAEKVAELRGLTVERLAAMSVYNALQLYPRIPR